MVNGRRPTTDSGTVVMHAALVVSFVVLLLTGLRIASDDPASMWLVALDPLLPMDHLWYRHLAAATVFAATLFGYAIYIIRARLVPRIRLDGARLSATLRPGRSRWAALNTIVYWLLIASLLIETITGIMLFVGLDGLCLTLHLATTWATIGLVALHIAFHAIAGGKHQLLRVLRPAPLVVAPPPPDFAELLAEQLRARHEPNANDRDQMPAPAEVQAVKKHPLAHPAAIASVAVVALLAGAIRFEAVTRPALRVLEVPAAEAPTIDGDLSDPVWAKVQPITVQTTQGGDFGGTGSSLVEIRAVHDARYAYFSFVWSDPTRSLKHQPLIKTAAGWQIVTQNGEGSNDSKLQEDKFSVLLSRPVFPLIGAAIHLAVAPKSDRPPSGTGRGMHYTPDGSIADVWIWRASHGGRIGHIDNGHFGAAIEPSKDHLEGSSRYPGGFALDPIPVPYRANVARGTTAAATAIVPERLPRDTESNTRALGRITGTTAQSESEGARWWLADSESVPYAKAQDNRIPVGTIIPSIAMQDDIPIRDDSVRGVARWAAGRWTLEIVRRLHTGSKFDVPIKSGTLIWVAAFDHAETRHSRHLRPIELEVD